MAAWPRYVKLQRVGVEFILTISRCSGRYVSDVVGRDAQPHIAVCRRVEDRRNDAGRGCASGTFGPASVPGGMAGMAILGGRG